MRKSLAEAARDLEYVSKVLDTLRFDGTDQNPKGIRDLLYSAAMAVKREAQEGEQ